MDTRYYQHKLTLKIYEYVGTTPDKKIKLQSLQNGSILYHTQTHLHKFFQRVNKNAKQNSSNR